MAVQILAPLLREINLFSPRKKLTQINNALVFLAILILVYLF